MRYLRKKADGNHAAIGKALRGVTIVTDVHTLGAIGCDYIARHVVTKQPMLIEVKDPTQPKCKRNRSENEAKMRDAYPNNWRMVTTGAEALAAVGILPTIALDMAFKPADLSPLARRKWAKACACSECGASLVVEEGDLFTRSSMSDREYYVTFECPRCRAWTDIIDTWPTPPSGGFPSRTEPLSPLARRLKRRGA